MGLLGIPPRLLLQIQYDVLRDQTAGEMLPCEVGAMMSFDKRGREDTTATK